MLFIVSEKLINQLILGFLIFQMFLYTSKQFVEGRDIIL